MFELDGPDDVTEQSAQATTRRSPATPASVRTASAVSDQRSTPSEWRRWEMASGTIAGWAATASRNRRTMTLPVDDGEGGRDRLVLRE
ncbi:hypothetical protein ACFY20_02635 [Streptomyces sp. NPDC001312]|uniref:hypothetical protein n=1 Tax=Streptomyces sp. NPDC001312 TaxID=3364561 RepID=UPI0036D1575A